VHVRTLALHCAWIREIAGNLERGMCVVVASEPHPSASRRQHGPPPEAVLIRTRREEILPKMSIRKAAEIADMSEAGWRAIENGRYEGPADKVATMARVVAVTPDELDEVGRGDAASMLRAYLRRRVEVEPTLAVIDDTSSEALIQLILQGLDDIRKTPGLSDEDKQTLEASLIRSVTQNVSGQLAHIRTVLGIAADKPRKGA
jgi:hypothetical protein